MPAFKDFIKNKNFEEAEKIFLKEADLLWAKSDYSKLRELTESFPEDYREKQLRLTLYYHISTNIIFPYAAREKLFELIPILKTKKEFDQIAIIYTTLLINYMYYDEDNEDDLNLSDAAQKFIKTSGSELSDYKLKRLVLWINMMKWWLRSDDAKAFDISYEIEEIAQELKDSAALIILRILLSDRFYFKGQFQKALTQFEKAERLIKNHKVDEIYAPLVCYWKSDTYMLMRMFNEAKNEAEKGMALIDEKCVFHDYLKSYLFLYHVFMQNYEASERIKEEVLYGELAQDAYFRIEFMYLGEMVLAYFAGKKEKAAYYCSKILHEKDKKSFLYAWPLNVINFAEVNLYIKDYESVVSDLKSVLKVKPQSDYAFFFSAAYALLGIMHDRKKDSKTAKKYFKKMTEVFTENEVEEIPILSNTLLSEIAQKSGSECIEKLLRKRAINETVVVPLKAQQEKHTRAARHHHIEICAFGALRLSVDGAELPATVLGRQKVLYNILKILVVFHGKCLPREFVYGMLWKGYDEKSARYNLNANLYRLRKLLGKDIISVDGDNIRLCESRYWLDVDAFEENIRLGNKMIRDGQPGQALKYFQAAEDLYKDNYIENDLYTECVVSEREILKNKYLTLLFSAIKLCLDQGDYFHAFEKGQKLIQYAPFCEAAYRLLMMACALSGDRSSLAALYRKLNQLLKHEFGVGTDEKTKKLMKALKDGAVPTSVMWSNEQLI